MKLVITLRKEVADRDEAFAIYQLVEQKFEDRPDIIVSGHVTNHFTEIEEPS